MILPTIIPPEQQLEGKIASGNSSFQVTEIPLYAPLGQGQHLYIEISKDGLNTQDLISQLAKLFSIPKKSIGHAGLKDRNALTTQWLSLDLGRNYDTSNLIQTIENNIPLAKVKQINWHNNKLKTGHLKGNHFKILIETNTPKAFECATQIIKKLNSSGIPNFYGRQRFGSKGDNGSKGKELLHKADQGGHHKTKFLLSAYQAQLFNQWLALRFKQGFGDKVIEGDIIINPSNGRVNSNPCDNIATPSPSCCYSGPIFGKRMIESHGKSREWEEQILELEKLQQIHFQKLPGSRRSGLIFAEQFALKADQKGLWLDFSLPKGSYATVVIDQFVRKG